METRPSEIEPLWLFSGRLNAAASPYMITGATAAILYGAPRVTNDLDVVLQLSAETARKLPTLFPESEFYLPPREVIEVERRRPCRGHFNIIHTTTGYKADVYLAGSEPLHAWGLEHRRQVQLEHGLVSLAPAEYVIIRKLEFFEEGSSTKHLDDIRAILQTSGTELDTSFLQTEVTRRGLHNAWNAAKAPSP